MRERIIASMLALGLASLAVLAAPAMAQEKASVGYYPGALISMPVWSPTTRSSLRRMV